MAEQSAGVAAYQLAQVNIARAKAPMTDPLMAGFMERLDEINALADRHPGFIWRLKPDPEDPDQLLACERDGLLFNLSVWRSVEDLRDFVFDSTHKELLVERASWFEKMQQPHLALWWVPAGHIPGIDEAMLRLDRLELLGPTQNAFTLAKTFPMPEPYRPKDDAD